MLGLLAKHTTDRRSRSRSWLDDDPLPDDAEDVRFARGVAVVVTLTFVGWSALWLAWRLV